MSGLYNTTYCQAFNTVGRFDLDAAIARGLNSELAVLNQSIYELRVEPVTLPHTANVLQIETSSDR